MRAEATATQIEQWVDEAGQMDALLSRIDALPGAVARRVHEFLCSVCEAEQTRCDERIASGVPVLASARMRRDAVRSRLRAGLARMGLGHIL